MKIGILTFHWATNYGAVLQCYALQSYLEQQGHIVEVINYKPLRCDDTFYTFIKSRKFLHLKSYIENRKKESALCDFRNKKLKQSKRVYSYTEIPSVLTGFDAIISGSDQVMNPTFLMNGEKQNTVSPTYFLGFPFTGRKIGYALSFGCINYPQNALPTASQFIKEFEYVSVREKTGVNIVNSMGKEGAIVVCDPTLLESSFFYNELVDTHLSKYKEPYIYNFFIRNITERKKAIKALIKSNKTLWNNDDNDYSIQGWLSKIKNAEFVVTDSFHCMVMCLKFHKPFAIITNKKGNVGMNDRFYTILEKMSLESHIIHKDNLEFLLTSLSNNFDWEKVDNVMDEISDIGKMFLSTALT